MPYTTKKYKSDIVIVGGGLTGLVAAYELLGTGKKILIIDRDNQEKLGGLARESYGGVMAVDTPLQRKLGIKDSHELAYKDWLRYANFNEDSSLEKKWAKKYIEYSNRSIYEWLLDKGIEFIPFINWPERGMFTKANSVPRCHLALGRGFSIVKSIIYHLENHKNRSNLSFKFRHRINSLLTSAGKISGCSGVIETTHSPFEVKADIVVASSGGMSGGDLSLVKKYWPADKRGELPQTLLNGSHRFSDGLIHAAVENMGGYTKNLSNQLLYPSGVHSPGSLLEKKGLSLVPPKSAIWLNAYGKRIGPSPLMGNTDTKFLVDEILKQPGKFSWQIINFNIAKKELALSGSKYIPSHGKIRKIKILKEILFGNKNLVNRLIKECDDFVCADTIDELVDKMNSLEPCYTIDKASLKSEIKEFDENIDRGNKFITDDQLRRIVSYRKYIGDRLTTCNMQKILDPTARPLIAIREFILAKKSLGGVVTDLESKVLSISGKPIPGLYAAGEIAGFGGGGIHGERSLEGTFLGSCIITAQAAAQSIKNNL